MKYLGLVFLLVLAPYVFAGEPPAAVTPQLGADSCYQITSKEELYAVRSLEYSSCIALQNDIVVNERVLDDSGMPDSSREDLVYWEPFEFAGIFEGNGHTISGLYVKAVSYAGFFSELGKGAIVRNLGIKDSYFEGFYVGSIAGLAQERTLFVNVFSEATVATKYYGGGIVGFLSADQDWSCLDRPALKKAQQPLLSASDSPMIINAYNLGRVLSSDGSPQGIGGIVGGSIDAILENTFNMGILSVDSQSGYIPDGLLGIHDIEECFYDGDKHNVEIRNSYYIDENVLNNYGGEKISASEIQDGSLLKKLREGMYGVAWEQDVGKDAYPSFKKVLFYIDYKLNGGKNSEKNNEYYSADSAFVLASPTKEGDVFEGWYTDSLYKNKIDTIAKGSTIYYTLYAKWESEYFVTYVTKGGKNSEINPVRWSSDSAAYTLKNIQKTGYTFEGWYSDSSFKTQVTELSKNQRDDLTLYAKWKAIDYKITYHLNGGVNNPENPSSFNFDKEVILENPTREGFVFVEWSDTIVYGHDIYELGGSDYYGRDFNLYAHWYPEPMKPKKFGNGCYAITNRNELYWFALYTSGEIEGEDTTVTHPCASQQNDIVVNEKLQDENHEWVDGIVLWHPIGIFRYDENAAYYYANGYSIYGLFANAYGAQSVWSEFIWHPSNSSSYPLFLNSCVNTKGGTIWLDDIPGRTPFAKGKAASFRVVALDRTLQVSGVKAGSGVSVFDMQGRVLKSFRTEVAEFTVNVPRAGSYIVRIGGETRRISVK